MPVDAGTIYSEIRIKIDALSSDIQKIESKLDQFSNKNKQQSEKVKNSWTDTFKKINLVGVAAFVAISMAMKKAIGTFAEYQQSMANVRSVTSASAEDFKLLEDAAIQAGESTRFTASQAAEALYFLASAGLSATQSIGALQGVLELAGATQSDLAFTSATMAATLSQFSLNANESTRVANVFASAISNSQANMEKLSSSLKQVGPISGALDISLEETIASLEALYNAGFAGEQAGTGLRNILLDLADSGGPVIKQLESLGIAFEDVNPKEVGLTQAIDVLAKSGIDLGNIFGKRVAAQILTLAKTGGDALRELQDEITDTNAAAEMYAIQNDTLAGSIDFLNSALESASIKIGAEIEPALRGLVDTLKSAVDAFNRLPGPVKVALVGIVALGPALAAMGASITFIAGSLSGIIGQLTIFGTIFAAGIVAQEMMFMDIKTRAINKALEHAVANGEDLNKAMVEVSKSMGEPIDKIKEIAYQNENINGILIEQDKINKEILSTYYNRVAAVGSELELNERLLINKGISGAVYRATLDLYLEQLEAQRAAIDLLNEQAAIEEEEARKREARNIEIAKLEEELRIAGLTEQEKAFDELEQKHREYLEAGLDDEEWYRNEVAKIIEQFADKTTPEESQEAENIKELTDLTEQYQDRLERLGATKLELIELDRQSAIENIKNSEEFINATETEKEAVLAAIDEYFDALKDNTANEIFKENVKQVAQTVLDSFSGIMGAISKLFAAMLDNQIADLDRWLEAELEAQGLVEETTIERLQRELEAAIETRDLELAAKLEEDIAREELQKEYERKKAQLEYESALKVWKLTLAAGIAGGISAVITAFGARPWPLGLFAGPAMIAKMAIETAALKKSEPQPPQLATGGLVIPTGSTGTQVNVAENGSPELLLNSGAEGQAFLNDFAKRIALAGNGSGVFTIILEMDGKRVAENTAKYYNNGIVRVKL